MTFIRPSSLAIRKTSLGPPTISVPLVKIATWPANMMKNWIVSAHRTAFMPPCKHTAHRVTLVIMVHYDVIKWKHFPRYYPFVRGTHRPNPRLVVIWDAITVIWRHRNVILRNMKNLHIQYFFNYWRRNRPGGRFNNTYELLNLRALKISKLHKNHIFQCMGKIFCVEFQRVPLKFHTKYLTHTLKDVDFIHIWKFKSSLI